MSLLQLFVLFQGSWFAIVLGGAAGTSAVGLGASAAVLALLCRVYPAKEVMTRALAGVALGLVLDGMLVHFGMTSFPTHEHSLLPLWMLALWANFAAMLPLMLPWLAGRRALAIGFGAAGGPSAYFSAELLDAIAVHGGTGYLAVGAAWGLAMAILPLRTQATSAAVKEVEAA